MLRNARHRAQAAGVPFLITIDDIIIPTHCPVLGIPLVKNKRGGGNDSPSLDRIKPHLGYVRGNIVVVSNKVNRIKSNATLEELRTIASFFATLDGEVRVTGAST